MFDELVAGHADPMITDGLEADDQAPPHSELAAVPAPFTRLKRDYYFARAPLMKELIDTWIGQDCGRPIAAPLRPGNGRT